MSGTLYLVGTPIGNLADATERARTTLDRVDLIAAEDTRRTGRLLEHFGIHTPLVSFFEGNERERSTELLRRIADGEDVAVVTDAGMPGLSDPGYRLVRACAREGIEIRVVPGPSAAIAALVISGMPTDRFAFEGFLPRKAGDRRARLGELALDPRTLVVFESPRRVRTLLEEALEAFGDREVAIARELTKLHEEVIRGRASEVLAAVADRDLKGEVVVVFHGADADAPDLDELIPLARKLVEGGMRKREAASKLAREHDVSANAIYERLLGPRD